MSAYRICQECGAALDSGERCDCRPAVPLKLIQPEAGQTSAPRHKRLMNADFTGEMGCTFTFAEGPQGRREDHAEAESDQDQPLQAGVRL